MAPIPSKYEPGIDLGVSVNERGCAGSFLCLPNASSLLLLNAHTHIYTHTYTHIHTNTHIGEVPTALGKDILFAEVPGSDRNTACVPASDDSDATSSGAEESASESSGEEGEGEEGSSAEEGGSESDGMHACMLMCTPVHYVYYLRAYLSVLSSSCVIQD